MKCFPSRCTAAIHLDKGERKKGTMKKTVHDWVPLLVKEKEQGVFKLIDIPELWPQERLQDQISSCEFCAWFSRDPSAKKSLLFPMNEKDMICNPTKCKAEKCLFLHQREIDALI